MPTTNQPTWVQRLDQSNRARRNEPEVLEEPLVVDAIPQFTVDLPDAPITPPEVPALEIRTQGQPQAVEETVEVQVRLTGDEIARLHAAGELTTDRALQMIRENQRANTIRHRGQQPTTGGEQNTLRGFAHYRRYAGVNAAGTAQWTTEGLQPQPVRGGDQPIKIEHNGGGSQYNRIRFASSLEDKG